jgi:hypothetical protein
MATRLDPLQSSRRFHLSFLDMDWEDSLHPSRLQSNTVQMSRSLIRKLCMHTFCIHPNDRATPSGRGPCYGNCVYTVCNRPDSRATPSGRGLNMETCEARYGKPVAQKTVRTLNALVWTPPREIRDKLDLGLLSL